MKIKLLSLAATILFAASVNLAFAEAQWLGNSAVNVNGTWYYCGNNGMSWCEGGSFNGGNLGEIFALYLGGQSQVYEEKNNEAVNWNGGSVTMFYKIDNEAPQEIVLNWYQFESNNNFFQSGGSEFKDTSIDISGFAAGQHTIAVWFNCDQQWDSNGGSNYVATFTKKAPTSIASSDDIKISDDPVDVQINGLTLYKDTYWNTLCLPFSLTATEIETSPLAGVVIRQLSESTLNDEGILTLQFSEAESIEAGVPYIVKWNNEGSNIVNPIFTGVKLSVNEPGFVDGDYMFNGTFASTPINGQNYLYLGANNTLYWPDGDVTVGAFHAYFKLNPSASSQGIKAFVLNFDDNNEATSIKQINNAESTTNSYFTLDGRRLNDKPSTSGIYIHNGKKVVIK